MIGDKLVITERHRANGRRVAQRALPLLEGAGRLVTITVAGESGSGKSETAATTAEALRELGHGVLVLGQDDYFRLPPRSNAARRLEEIAWVGPGEVHLDLMDRHLRLAREGATWLDKPLVYFEEDRVGQERVSLEGVAAVIAEGTYTSLLEADLRVFLEATFEQTLEHRKARARDTTEGDFIERVLTIEHEIISAHRERCDLSIPA